MLGNQHVRFGEGQSEKERLMIPLNMLGRSKKHRNLAGCLLYLSERKDSYQLHERTQLRVNAETGQVLAATMVANQKVASVTYYGQKRELVDIKELREEYQQIASHVLQDVILRVERAFQRFFDGAGYPRFKGRDRYDSFTYPDGAGWKLTVEEQGKRFLGSLRLTNIGTIKVKLHRKIEGTIKTVTIKREVDQWFVVVRRFGACFDNSRGVEGREQIPF